MKKQCLLLLATVLSPFAWTQAGQLDGYGGHNYADQRENFQRQPSVGDELTEPTAHKLQAQVTTQPVFSAKCAVCHGNAANFARKSLQIKNNVLVASKSQQQVLDYLANHGGLRPDEIAPMVEALTQIRLDVSGTEK
jgi:hypothetical protein